MKKKIVAFILVFAIALALGIGGTMAWLTATSGEVVNTFTVGNIELTLAEYGEDNVKLESAEQKAFKILPGATDVKKPVLTVTAGSEKCYVYACVTNNVKLTATGTPVATPNFVSGDWETVYTDGTMTLYRYKDIVDVVDNAEGNDQDIVVFESVTYSGTITMEDADTLKDTTIKVQGFAHQSEHTDTTTADAAATGHFWPSAS